MSNNITVLNLRQTKLYQTRYIILFILFAILTTCFIFHNSIQDSTTSNGRSGIVAEEIKPILDPDDKIPEQDFHKLIRKFAHGIEFCALGICLGALMYSIQSAYKRYHFAMCLFLSLSVAVMDEYIQSFTGRTSSVKDVLIDFGGTVVGIILVCLLRTLFRWLSEKWRKNCNT